MIQITRFATVKTTKQGGSVVQDGPVRYGETEGSINSFFHNKEEVMKKKALSVALSVSMALGLLAAVPMSAGADEVEEITWMFWDDPETSEDLISKGFGEVVERFNTDYEGKYHVTMITTQLEEYYTQLNALVAAGETPDVFIVSPGPNLTDYVAPGVAAPLDEYLEADGWKETFSSDALFSQMT